MSDSVLVWLAVAALLFWAMGAYNRLMRLRSQGIVAFVVLEGLFNEYVQLVKTCIPREGAAHSAPEAKQGLGPCAAAWAGLVAANEQFNASLKVAQVRPLNGATMRALRTAFETLCLSWSRLRELPPDLAGSALPADLQLQWEQLAVRAEMARAEFNRRVVSYNQAISQFPALVLAWLFGFKPAQPI